MKFEDQIQKIADKSELHKLVDELPEDGGAMLITWDNEMKSFSIRSYGNFSTADHVFVLHSGLAYYVRID